MTRASGIPALTVMTALLMGATVHATANTVLTSLRMLGLVTRSVQVLFFCWLLLAAVFSTGAAVWLFRTAEGKSPRLAFTLAFWAATLPSIATEREAFTVLPFVLNIYVDVAGVQWGANMVGAAAFIFFLWTLRRPNLDRAGSPESRKVPREPDAIESQIGG
jgi:hypothetical protein